MTRPEIPEDDRPDYDAAREEREEAGAVAGEEERPEPVTTYQIHRVPGIEETQCASTAETWSSLGARVTAVTEGDR